MLRVSSEDGTHHRNEGALESYRQLGRSLHELQVAADQIFDTILERTSKERDKLAEISQRIQTAKAKIDAISRCEQALIVTSPSRYPSSSNTEEDFSPLFQYKDVKTGDGFLAKLLVNGGLNREFGKDGTLELFQFFSEENIESPSNAAQSKVRTHLDENMFLEDLLKEPKFTSNRDVADVTLESEKPKLPPPPPSLLRHNIPSLRNLKDSKSASTGAGSQYEASRLRIRLDHNH